MSMDTAMGLVGRTGALWMSTSAKSNFNVDTLLMGMVREFLHRQSNSLHFDQDFQIDTYPRVKTLPRCLSCSCSSDNYCHIY